MIARALATELALDVAETAYRGHAVVLAQHAAAQDYELVIVLAGDGTVNEAVNGLMACSNDVPIRATLAVIPGGNANVFARALQLPREPVEATGALLEGVRRWSVRTIGLGKADARYFTFCAGLGFDAEVIRAVESLRASGRQSSQPLYVWTTIRNFFGVTDRRRPALSVERVPGEPLHHVFLGVVSNATPWTYIGRYPVAPNPRASFDAGLDLFALRSMRTLSALNQVRQFLTTNGEPPRGRHTITLRDLSELTLRASRPTAFQLDGDYLGERERVAFRAVPQALRVVMSPPQT